MTNETGVLSLRIPFTVKEEHTGALFEDRSSPNDETVNTLIAQAKIRPTKYTNPLISLFMMEPKVNKHTIRKGANRKNKYNIEFKFNSILMSILWVYKLFH